MTAGRLHVLGVRHHSPACARRVGAVLAALKPRFVLVEGPADFNARMGELLLSHALPLALFTYYRDEERTAASWTPFCDYSPEWVAIREGHAVGADVRFMDLPAWSKAFAGVRNRYQDGPRRVARYVDVLGAKLGIEGLDALWDHLFEQPMPVEVLSARLDAYFHALREAELPSPRLAPQEGSGSRIPIAGEEARPIAGEEGSGIPAHGAEGETVHRDAMREAFMVRCVNWALAQGGDVVVVCGGFHQPAIERVASAEAAEREYPVVEEPPPEARHGTYLVPYSFRRLDSFVGYESGMPSPGYHQAVWEHGPEAAPARMLGAVIRHLRQRGQHVSTADLVAASTLAEGLARLRGHSALARTDLLDAMASALVKEGLDAPLPWALRGTVGAGTDALLVEMLAALSGAREGKLAKGTPLPPLVADVESTLDAQGLAPADAPRDVVLDLGAVDPPVSPTVSPSRAEGAWSRRRSATLHRLRLLGIPGFTRKTGPAWATDADLRESWTIVRSTDAPSALIEAGAWGATLEDAARGRLEELLAQSGGHVAKMAEILGEAVFAGLLSFADSVLVSIARAVASEASLGALGGALSRLRALWRHDRVLGSSGSTTIAAVLSAGFDRGCWLLEGIRGKSAPLDETLIAAVCALRDLARDATRGDVAIDSTHLVDICRRTAADPESPPSIRGATLGAMWSLGALGVDDEAREHAGTQLRAVALPATLGDFLAGLFALAREQIVHAPELVLAVDEVVAAMPVEDFFVAVPSLRLAFSYFPPRERDAIARRVLRHHGGDPDDARRLRRLGTDPATVARALSMEAQADAVLSRYGLGPEPTDAGTEEP